MDWNSRAVEVSPLLGCAAGRVAGGQAGVLRQLLATIAVPWRLAVECGGLAGDTGPCDELATDVGWHVLHLDREAVTATPLDALLAGRLAAEDLDVLVIALRGKDYWVWDALGTDCRPSLVIVGFNARVAWDVAATIEADAGSRPSRDADHGASFAALCALAMKKGYRLIHVHGRWSLYFLRADLALPDEWSIKTPLAEADLALLTEVRAGRDGAPVEVECGSAPGAAPPAVWMAPWEIIAPAAETRQLEIAGIRIEVLADKQDANWYLQRKTFEEGVSLLYRFIRDEGFDNFVDIGANVGYVSIVAARASPRLRIVAMEADPRLARLIRRNFAANGVGHACVVNAVVGECSAASMGFSLNPSSTLDNRVSIAKWAQVRVPMIRPDDVLAEFQLAGRSFYKIDTQGFELHVLRGLETTLATSHGWRLKMEFAPEWLRSQGTEPESVLDHLQARYEFVEYPERIVYGTLGLDALFANPVRAQDHADFIRHVVALNRNGLGWVDLLVRPRPR